MRTDIQLTDGFILLRPYRTEDVHQHYAAAFESMAELKPYMPWAHDAYTIDETAAWVAELPNEGAKGISYTFAITDPSTGQYLGGCGLNHFDSERRTANLGYWVRTVKTRQGVATASMLLLARFGIQDLKLKRIGLAIAVPNKASQRVAEKAGAVREGVLRNGMFVRDMKYDAVIFSFIPEDFGLQTTQ